jgi:hypothetical protein
MVLRVVLNSEVGRILRRVIDLDDALESQIVAVTAKFDLRNAIPEDIVQPPHLRRLGRHIEREINQSLVETIARACHQLMSAEPDRAPVPICRDMPDEEDRHGTADRREVRACSLAA